LTYKIQICFESHAHILFMIFECEECPKVLLS
jgi:hypothetical protein